MAPDENAQRRWIRRLKIVFGILGTLLAVGCAPAAAPPAPIAEIPAVVSFPQDISIDLSAVGGQPASTPSQIRLAQTVSGGGEFSGVISTGPITIAVADDLLDTLLQPLQSLEIPVSPQIRTFEGAINIPNVFPQKLKVDFAPFDFDGDGTSEGIGCTCPVTCSGETCPTEAPLADLKPVSYRIWIQNPDGNFVPFMAGLFDILRVKDNPQTPENEENTGKGRFRAGFKNIPSSQPPNTTVDNFFGAAYDFKDPADPLHQTSELFAQNHQFDASKTLILDDNFHSRVEQKSILKKGIPPTLQKTAELSFQETPPAEGKTFDIQYLGRFLEDFDFWSGSFSATKIENGQPITISGTDVCAQISTGNGVDPRDCLDLGIDVDNEPFIPPATPADVAFPADFPPLPTF